MIKEDFFYVIRAESVTYCIYRYFFSSSLLFSFYFFSFSYFKKKKIVGPISTLLILDKTDVEVIVDIFLSALIHCIEGKNKYLSISNGLLLLYPLPPLPLPLSATIRLSFSLWLFYTRNTFISLFLFLNPFNWQSDKDDRNIDFFLWNIKILSFFL